MTMKPNIKFLQKVERREVQLVKGYSTKRGGYWKWYGGEATARKHAEHGYVEIPRRGPSLGEPSVVILTDKGRAALAMAH